MRAVKQEERRRGRVYCVASKLQKGDVFVGTHGKCRILNMIKRTSGVSVLFEVVGAPSDLTYEEQFEEKQMIELRLD